MSNPFKDTFKFEHILCPIMIAHLRDRDVNGANVTTYTRRIVYIFGIRVISWSTTRFQ